MENQSVNPAFAALVGFLSAHGVSNMRFCVDVNIGLKEFYSWRRRVTLPKLTTAFAIEDYTRGAVPARLWLQDGRSHEGAA